MNAVTAWAPPTRLAYPDRVSERFNIDAIKWKALVETIYPNATSVDSIVMALSYCEARKLDPFKRPVHIVPVWSKALNKMVDTVWPGISELRTTAMRTALYAGKDKTQFGPNIIADLGGVQVTYPEWAQTTVYRVVPGIGRCAFEGPEVSWIESYAKAGRDTAKPNEMWLKRPRGQLDKCSEAAALRTAFPEELGNEFAAEEMEGQAYGQVRDVTPARTGLRARLEAAATSSEGFSAAGVDAALNGDQIPDHDTETGEVIEATATTPADDFPGDPRPGEGSAAGPAEANADEETGPADDLTIWANDLLTAVEGYDMPAFEALEGSRIDLARFAQLKVVNLDLAQKIEAAMVARKKALAS